MADYNVIDDAIPRTISHPPTLPDGGTSTPRPAPAAGLHVKHPGQVLNTASAQSTGRRRGGQDAPDNRRCEDWKNRRPARGASAPRRDAERPLRTRRKRRGRAQGLGPVPPPGRTPLPEGLTEASTLGRARPDGPHAWHGGRGTRHRPAHGGKRPVPACGNGAPHCPVPMVRHRVRGHGVRGPPSQGGGGRRCPVLAGAYRPSDRPCAASRPAGRHGRPCGLAVRAGEVGGAERPGTSLLRRVSPQDPGSNGGAALRACPFGPLSGDGGPRVPEPHAIWGACRRGGGRDAAPPKGFSRCSAIAADALAGP